MQLFNRFKYLRLGESEANAKRPCSNRENACQTDPLQEPLKQSDRQTDSMSIASGRKTKHNRLPDELLSNLFSPAATSTVRATHFNNLLYHRAKLHEFHWTLFTQQKKYKSRESLACHLVRRQANTLSVHP
jgi:hypothetical protein